MASPLSDAEKLAVLRFQLLIHGQAFVTREGKIVDPAKVTLQLQQFQNNPPQG
ncbi:hypothetical protein NKI13_18390 [Mesorhizobium australicum]|uniref:hypothetical protein n=1 Tax=Mesorhizobium australicum TaxID=536018 RepID=UPI00333794F5